jgi:polyphosphate kinase
VFRSACDVPRFQRVPLELPRRPPSKGYVRMPKGMQTYVPDHAATLVKAGAPAAS